MLRKKEEKELKDNLNELLEYAEEIYKLSYVAEKFCEHNKESDDLYEISAIVKLIKEKLDIFARDLYDTIHMHDKPYTYEQLGERIKKMLS